MAGEIVIKLPTTGLTLKAMIVGPDRNYRWNNAALALFASIADVDWATGMVILTEQSSSDATATGIYVGTFPAAITTAGEFLILFYSGAAPTPGQVALGQQTFWWDGTQQVAPSDNIYTAEAKYTRDEANSQDRYTVQWLKNGIIVPDTDISSAVLSVYLDTGVVLINNKAMTERAAPDIVVYTAVTTERLTVGVGAVAQFKATINGAVRTWPLTISRDSE